MKKVLFICCFIIGVTAICRAQDGGNRTPEERAKKLQTELKLSNDQTTKITAIYKKSEDPLNESKEPIDNKIKAVLTPKQVASYNKIINKTNKNKVSIVGLSIF